MTYPDLIGALLAIFSFLLVSVSPAIRKDTSLLLASFFTLGLHHCAAICNAFFFELMPNLYDAGRYHRLAADPALSADFTEYSLFLKQVYRTFGTSHFLGEEMSVLAFALSIPLFVWLIGQVKLEPYAVPLLLVYGLLPSHVIHCSVTMRESFQALCFVGAVCAIVRMKKSPDLVSALGLLVSLWAMVSLHQALGVYALLLLFGGLSWALRERKNFAVSLALALVVCAPVALPKIIHRLMEKSAAFNKVMKGELGSYTEEYRSLVGGMAASDYGFEIDTGSVLGTVTTVPIALVLFHLAPLPWQVRRFVDLYAFCEVVLRLLFFWGTYRRLRQADAETRDILWFLLGASVVLDCLWGMGTANWGTASRHHLVAYPIWVVLGGYWVFQFQMDNDYAHLLARQQARKAGRST